MRGPAAHTTERLFVKVLLTTEEHASVNIGIDKIMRSEECRGYNQLKHSFDAKNVDTKLLVRVSTVEWLLIP